MKLFLLLALSSIFLFTSTQSQDQVDFATPATNTHEVVPHHEQINHEENVDQALLEQQQQKQNQLELDHLTAWVAHQLNNSKSVREFSPTESFITRLQQAQSYEYRWDLAIPNSQQRDYHLELNVFTYEEGTDINFSHDPQEDSFISVQIRQNMHDNYRELGKVYVTRTFVVNFQKEAQIIRFKNYNPHPVLLQINMEKQLQQVQHIKNSIAVDKQFQISAKKLNTIFQQAKQTDKERTQMYKWEWGFLQREERYESDMLKLTGVQLLAILATAIIQMYCIKALLDNKLIV